MFLCIFTVNIELFMKRITIKLNKWTSETQKKTKYEQPYSINDRFIDDIFSLKKKNMHWMHTTWNVIIGENCFKWFFGIVQRSEKNTSNSPKRKFNVEPTKWIRLNMKTESFMVSGFTRGVCGLWCVYVNSILVEFDLITFLLSSLFQMDHAKTALWIYPWVEILFIY